jgi:hypothetical protein
LHLEGDFHVQKDHDHFGKAHRADAIRDRQLFQLFGNPRLFAHASRVENLDRGAHPVGAHRDRIAGDARLWPRQQTVKAEDLVDQRRFARVGAADHRDLQRFFLGRLVSLDILFSLGVFFGDIKVNLGGILGLTLGKLAFQRFQHAVKVVHPLAMFSRKAQRFAQTKAPALQRTGIACFAFGLVDPKDHPCGFLAQNVSKGFVRRRNPHPTIDQEQAHIGHVDGALGQAAHAALKAVVGHLFQTRRVDHGKAQVEQLGIAFAQIARHAGLVIDQRQFAPHKAVEKGRFAHIGAAHDSEGKAHVLRPTITKRLPYTGKALPESVKLPVLAGNEQHPPRKRRSRGRT